jgi:predicted ArsR family transcriptional regulator
MTRKTYWISRPEQLSALKSPLRQDILDHLVALGPLPVRTLAAGLGCNTTAIYRHLQILEQVGLVASVHTSGELGRPAGVYRAIAPIVRTARAPRDPRNRKVMASAAKATALRAAREYGEAFSSDEWRIDGAQRNHWLVRLLAAPSRQKLERINGLLDQIVELIWTPDPDPGPPVHVTWIISPALPSKKAGRSK